VASSAMVVPFERCAPGRQVLIDSGDDSVFLFYGYDEPWDRAPTTVAVHKHDDVDETIVVFGGEGYYLHGRTPETVVRTPWKGPCLIWMPAGQYHRIVTTVEGFKEAILIYSPAGTRIDRFERAIGRAVSGEVELARLPVVPLTTARPAVVR
jgi:hypothetical protein